jgi:hypothetical protein
MPFLVNYLYGLEEIKRQSPVYLINTEHPSTDYTRVHQPWPQNQFEIFHNGTLMLSLIPSDKVHMMACPRNPLFRPDLYHWKSCIGVCTRDFTFIDLDYATSCCPI